MTFTFINLCVVIISFPGRFLIHGNSFEGPLPTNFTSPDFSELSVFRNSLTGTLPPGLFGLTSLTKLYLHNNTFDGMLSEDFGKLVNLKVLYLHYNDFTGTVPASFGTLKMLKKLEISKGLTGSLPSDICSINDGLDVGVECGHTLDPCDCCYDACTDSTFPV